MRYKPLDLPYSHTVYDGIPVPTFITEERMLEIRDHHVSKPGDVYICTYPKCGTTWLQHITNQLLGEPQGKGRIDEVAPWISFQNKTFFENMATPRIIKTHARWNWFPKSDLAKYIYCYRNPKDVAVSFFHHYYAFNGKSEGYNETFDEFFESFARTNHMHFGFYFDHVSEWLEHKDEKNILFLTYEDMVEDLEREVIKIAAFLNQELEQKKLCGILESGSFSSMQKDENVTYNWFPKRDPDLKMIRKGIVGDWKNHMSEAQSDEIEKLVESRLRDSGATIRYTL